MNFRFGLASQLCAPSLLFGALLLVPPTLGGCEKSSAAVQPVAARVGLTWDEHQAHVYQVELLSTPQLSGAPAAGTLVLRSRLKLSFRRSGGALQALLELVQPTLLNAAGKPAPGMAQLEAELGRPFAV